MSEASQFPGIHDDGHQPRPHPHHHTAEGCFSDEAGGRGLPVDGPGASRCAGFPLANSSLEELMDVLNKVVRNTEGFETVARQLARALDAQDPSKGRTIAIEVLSLVRMVERLKASLLAHEGAAAIRAALKQPACSRRSPCRCTKSSPHATFGGCPRSSVSTACSGACKGASKQHGLGKGCVRLQ